MGLGLGYARPKTEPSSIKLVLYLTIDNRDIQYSSAEFSRESIAPLTWNVISRLTNRWQASRPDSITVCFFSQMGKFMSAVGKQGWSLDLEVSVSRPSRDLPTSRLGLVSDTFPNVSVSSRSRGWASRISSRSRLQRSRWKFILRSFCDDIVKVKIFWYIQY